MSSNTRHHRCHILLVMIRFLPRVTFTYRAPAHYSQAYQKQVNRLSHDPSENSRNYGHRHSPHTVQASRKRPSDVHRMNWRQVAPRRSQSAIGNLFGRDEMKTRYASGQ